MKLMSVEQWRLVLNSEELQKSYREEFVGERERCVILRWKYSGIEIYRSIFKQRKER